MPDWTASVPDRKRCIGADVGDRLNSNEMQIGTHSLRLPRLGRAYGATPVVVLGVGGRYPRSLPH